MQGILGASARSFAGRIAGALSALIASYFITTTLPIDESGIFFLSLGFALFFSHVLRFGLDNFVLKKCAIFLGEARNGEFVTVVILSTLICMFGSVLFYAMSHVAEWAGVYEYARYVVLAFPAGMAIAVMGILAFSLHAAGFVFIGTVTNVCLNYLIFSCFIWFFEPANAVEAINYLSSSSLVALAMQIIVALILFRERGLRFTGWHQARPSSFDFGEVYRTAFPLWIVVIAQQLNLWGAQFISSIYVDEKELALLAMAMRIALIVPMVLTSVNLVVSPKFASLYHGGDMAKIEEVLQKSLQLLAAVSSLIFLFVIFFGGDLLRIFGSQYVEAKVLLSILVCGQLVNALTGPCGKLLMMSGFENDIRNSSVVVTLFGLALAFLLASRYGACGAAVATATTIATQNLYFAYLVKKRLQISLLRTYSNMLR